MNKITITTVSLFAMIVGNEILTWLILCVLSLYALVKIFEGMSQY